MSSRFQRLARSSPLVVLKSGLRRVAIPIGVACFFAFPLSPKAAAPEPKRVLVLYSGGRGFGPFSTVAWEFQTELARESTVPIQFQEASVEALSLEPVESEEPIVAYVRVLSKAGQPDLIVPFGAPAVRFALRQREGVFASKPILLASVEARFLKGVALGTNTTAVRTLFDFPAAAENILRLWPGMTNLVIVHGASPLEHFWKAQVQRDLGPYSERMGIEWLDHLPLAQMEERVKRLPPRSVIFYTSVIVDAAGIPYELHRPLAAVRRVANAPIVSLFEEDLGLGPVGGPLLNLREVGRRTAGAARRILNGEAPAAIVTPPIGPGKPVYDWRELQRWHVSVSRLPAGSEIRFRAAGFVQQYRWRILGLGGVVLVEGGLILALVWQLRQRHRSEQSLRQSEERMKLAADAAKLGIWEWDMGLGRVWTIGYNPEFSRLSESGWTRFETVLQSVHPDDQKSIWACLAKAFEGDGQYECTHRSATPPGRPRWITSRGLVEFDSGHRPVRMRGIWLDVTARKEAEDRAQESERRFVLLANAAPVLIWASGPDKRCTFFNEPWLRFTGRTLEEELGDGWMKGVHPDDLSACVNTYTNAFEGRLPLTMEYRLRRHDGQYRWIADHGVPHYDSQGAFLGFIGSCLDVTEHKQAEAEVQRSRQELTHVSRLSTLGELAGSMAHELNQPLSAILSNAQAGQRLLNSRPPDLAEVRDILHDIAEQDRRAGEVIVRMRAMLRKGQVQMLPLNLNDVVGDVLKILRSELLVRNITPILRLASSLPLVRGDRIQLQQVLMNLVINACEAMNDCPTPERALTIQTELVDARLLQTTVIDCGRGFTPEMLSRPFEPFRSTKPAGLGLGLAICRSIIHAHGGEIRIANNATRGATIHFTLAALDETAE